MRNLDNELKNKTINYNELLKYGFIHKNEIYSYKTKIYNERFEMIVEVKENKFTSKLIDLANEDEYILVDVQDSTGEFVGKLEKNMKMSYKMYKPKHI